MRLLACSYEHIGPFLNEIYLVRFLPGASLIKAPIGSGKSFLFFDGPIFGLYKWSTRPMISRHAPHGQIQVLFSQAGALWLIIRRLKATKAGNDSVTSKLFRVHASEAQLEEAFFLHGEHEVIVRGVSITAVCDESRLEEVVAIGQKEIDGIILDLLPSREVTLSSCVLMQDSDNVFEMTPTERIAVFKQLFDLLDIDHVRDHLAELKKTTQLRRQVLQDDTTVQQQFANYFAQVDTPLQRLLQMPLVATHPQIADRLQMSFFKDLLHLDLQEAQITGSFLQGYDAEQTKQLVVFLDGLLQAQLMRQGQGQQLAVQYEELKQMVHTLTTQQAKETVRLQQIQDQLEKLPVTQVSDLQQRIGEIDHQLGLLDLQLPVAEAQKHGLVFTSILQAKQLMQEQITEAKQLQYILTHDKELLGVLTVQLAGLRTQLVEGEQQLEKLLSNQKQTEVYRCEKIQEDCPYVAVIRKLSTRALDEQQVYLEEQLRKLREVTLPDCLLQIEQLTQKTHQLTDQIAQKKHLFTQLGRKELEVVFSHADELFAERKTHTDLLRDLHLRAEQSSELLIEQQTVQQNLDRLATDIVATNEKVQELQNALQAYHHQELQDTVQAIKQCLSMVQRIDQLIEQIAGLIDQYILRQQQIRELQEKEATLKDLLHIFQKELLLVVLQDFLPVLEEVINTYLQKIVPFSLRFELPKTMQEQIELAIWIEDEKGKRAVKSLSGGQKAVLRLCRILAVSTLFKQEYLLLDETINSLDQDAIGRVAELLESFVKQREMAFYLVTHATQIQEMSFWHRVIELEKFFS